MSAKDGIESLRLQWRAMYSETLPALARAHDTAQSKWPVTLDHCFARIILDNTVGKGESQWDTVIKKPAVKNMTTEQLEQAIALGVQIRNGEKDLVELDQQSLRARGKGETKYKSLQEESVPKKRGHEELDESKDTTKHSPKKAKQSTLSFAKRTAKQDPELQVPDSSDTVEKTSKSVDDPTIDTYLHKIARDSTLTEYRKRLYSTLLSVPSGNYTTYAAMAAYLKSSARAVGNGMRNNPYAPEVPCHRVLAADGSLGGYGGHWGKDGKHANKKVDLLKSEGVAFDSRGKVKGPVFTDLQDLSKLTKVH